MMNSFDLSEVFRRNKSIYGDFVMVYDDSQAAIDRADVELDLASAYQRRDGVLSAARDAGRTSERLTDSERREYDAACADITRLESRRDGLERTDAQHREQAARDRENRLAQLHAERMAQPYEPQFDASGAGALTGGAGSGLAARAAHYNARMTAQGREACVYTAQRGGYSWFRDMAAARSGDYNAAQRLARVAEIEGRALSTTTGGIGEFTPPAYLVDEFIALARPGRPTANLLTREALPEGVSSIEIPRIKTGSSVTEQATQNTAVTQVDITTDMVTADIATFAGAQTLSQQLLDRSPISVDQMVLTDLAADYAKAVDGAVLNGSTTLDGLLANAGSVDYSTDTPSASGVVSAVAQAVAKINSARYLPPTAVVMSPTRWAWLCSETDGNGRPLVVPTAGMNAFGTGSAGSAAEGSVGTLAGIAVYTDSQIPTNGGTGTNQDSILVGRMADAVLYEGDFHAEMFPQTYASQLSWLARVYQYAALAIRTTDSFVAVTGTGLVTPVFGS